MAKIVLDIPDGQVARVEDAVAENYAYETARFVEKDKEGQPTKTESKSEFAKRMIIQFIMSQVHARETRMASEQAQKEAAAKVKEELKIT